MIRQLRRLLGRGEDGPSQAPRGERAGQSSPFHDPPAAPADLPADPDAGEVLLRVDELSKRFPASGTLGGRTLRIGGDADGSLVSLERETTSAVENVSVDVRRGETLGLVGESGCGKTTLVRTLLCLLDASEGRVYWKGRDVTAMGTRERRALRADVQPVFQDAHASLNPRMRVGRIVAEPMAAHDMRDPAGRRARVHSLLETVGLDAGIADRYPQALSGGQRQRVALARALSVEPDLVVCDEPVSSLDASIQAQILETMADLQERFDLTYLFVAHDLSVVRHVSDRVAVMYLGRLVELADTEAMFEDPRHPYTEALLAAAPVPDPRAGRERTILPGEVPSPIDPPSGCRFHTRCPQLLAPPECDVGPECWDAVRTFVRAVDRRTFDAESERAVRARFFADLSIGGTAGDVVEAAIDDVLADRWADAADRLERAFVAPTACARECPAAHVEHSDGSRRVATCHRLDDQQTDREQRDDRQDE